ncbi:MAG: hypothetical protein AAGU74_10510 [Bacillota bacterium]
MSRKSNRGTMAIGTPSAILVFVVLCLTSFGALAFSTANADLKLCAQTAQSVTDYYAADARAQRALMKLDEKLFAMPEIDAAELAKSLAPLAGSVQESADGAKINMAFPFGKYQALNVTVELSPKSGARYEITDYSSIMINEPEYGQERLNIWDGVG